MSEITPAGGGPNRLFVVLAIGLAALLVLGLVGLGGMFVIQNIARGPAPTVRVAIATATRPAAVPTIAPAAATSELATPTLVLTGGAGLPVVQTIPTATPTTAQSSGGELPQSGIGEDLLLLAGGIILVMIIFVSRRVRTA